MCSFRCFPCPFPRAAARSFTVMASVVLHRHVELTAYGYVCSPGTLCSSRTQNLGRRSELKVESLYGPRQWGSGTTARTVRCARSRGASTNNEIGREFKLTRRKTSGRVGGGNTCRDFGVRVVIIAFDAFGSDACECQITFTFVLAFTNVPPRRPVCTPRQHTRPARLHCRTREHCKSTMLLRCTRGRRGQCYE